MVNGKKIRALRKNENLSTVEFAEKMYVSQSLISQLENGFKKPSVELLQRIADYFGCTIDDLIDKQAVTG